MIIFVYIYIKLNLKVLIKRIFDQTIEVRKRIVEYLVGRDSFLFEKLPIH